MAEVPAGLRGKALSALYWTGRLRLLGQLVT